jgi:hypothetical protein
LELFLKMFGDKRDCSFGGRTEIFESPASIILQPLRSSLENEEELKWAYLIAKIQDIVVDHSILRLINSCLYSQKAKNSIAYNVLKTIHILIKDDRREENVIDFTHTRDIPKALVKILLEVHGEKDVIILCLVIAHILVASEDDWEVCMNFMEYGICGALKLVMKKYVSDEKILVIQRNIRFCL